MTRRPVARLGHLLLVAAVAAVGAVTLVVAPQAPPAEAADLRLFDPGHIISDAVFYDANTMTVAQIQAFLDDRGSRCTSSSSASCLKDFRQTTTTRPADARCQGAYAGASNETAAQIISKVARACGINPQVILVTLQKEQGLVTSTFPRGEDVYRKAMGFGCPDTAACDPQHAGFVNQVYRAAWQFKNYALNPNSYSHRAGVVNQVRFHPNASCGSSAVLIRNQATAGLYNYTPYQPNAAALAAGYGTGDSCSAYGNRNFWNYFSDWFGSPTHRQPIGSLDAVSTAAGAVTVRGWALDLDTTDPIQVHVHIDGRPAAAFTANQSRPDVDRAYGRGPNHGFETSITVAQGTRRVCVYAIDDARATTNPLLGCRTVSVANATPAGSFDAASAAPGGLSVRGWAFDPDSIAPIQVHVYVDGRLTDRLTADVPRSDVARAYPGRTSHGFQTTVGAAAGPRRVCVYAIDAGGGPNPLLACRDVVATNATPRGSLDDVTTQTGEVTVRGWAADPDTTDPIRYRVRVDGAVVIDDFATVPRSDVGRALGLGDDHGFLETVAVAPGQRTVCLEILDASTSTSHPVRCDTVLVNGLPFGSVDEVSGLGGGSVRVRGWAIDPNTRDPIAVHVYVDGRIARSVVADVSRPDVDRAHGMGAAHGFDLTLEGVAVGTRNVCVYGIDAQGERNPLLRCVTVGVS